MNNAPYQYHHTVRLHEIDAAGILFHGQIFTINHNAHEEVMATAGLPVEQIIDNHPFSIPVVHTEADYIQPIRLGEQLTLSVFIQQIGNRSFTLKTMVDQVSKSGATKRRAEVTTVHVTIELVNGQAIPLPGPVRDALKHIPTL